MLANQSLPFLVGGGRPLICVQQVANEEEVVRKSCESEFVEARVVFAAETDIREITLKLRAREYLYQPLAQLQEVVITTIPEVKARQFVVPGTIGKLLYGALVNLLLLLPQPVLFQKLRQPLVQPGIIGIAIDLLAQHRQRLGQLLG